MKDCYINITEIEMRMIAARQSGERGMRSSCLMEIVVVFREKEKESHRWMVVVAAQHCEFNTTELYTLKWVR